MSSVNLETYSLSLLAAKEDILNCKCSTNWAVFTYEKRNDLKLSDSGAGGLEELAGKCTDNRILYALCQVKDPNTGQPRIILINWAGEKVDEAYRQTCAAHLPAIKAFFKEASVILTARRADEVTSDAIHNVLSSLSVAGSTSRKPRAMDSEELVGTNYRKTNPALEMRRTKRDSFWAQAEREEEERKEEERRRLQDERKRWDRERMEQEKREAEERERRIREKEHLIEEQRKEQARIQAEERKKEKAKWDQQQKEHEDEMRDRFRRSESIEKAAEAAVLVSQRSWNPREFFRQRENSFSSSFSQSPTSPTAGGTRRPAMRYQRSLTESAFIFRKSEPSSSTPPSPSPSPSYARRNEFFSSTSPRSPPETCSPSLIFSKAGAPTRPGRFPMASPPRAGSHPNKIFSRADSLPATSLTHYGSLRPTSPPNIGGYSPTNVPRPEPISHAALPRSEMQAPDNPPKVNSVSPTSPPREESKPFSSPPTAESTAPTSLPKEDYVSSVSLPRYESSLPDSPPMGCLPLSSSIQYELPPSSSPPRVVSPPMSSPTVDPVMSSSSDRANSQFSVIATRYESAPDGLTPRANPVLSASPPRAASPPIVSSPTVDPVLSSCSERANSPFSAISTRCEPVPEDSMPRAEPALSACPPRAASPPIVSSHTTEHVLSSSYDRAESPLSAISTRCEFVLDDSMPRDESAPPANSPRAVSPSLATMSNESSVSLECTPNEESGPQETIHHVESAVESQDVTESLLSESQPKYEAEPEETSLVLETLSKGLSAMRLDVLETSTGPVSFTEEAYQSELVASKDPSTFNSDIISLSAMLHTLPHYTPLETEWETSNSVQLEDVSAAPGHSHREDAEPDATALPGSGDPHLSHPSQEPHVNGARHNGIGGQEDEEVLQEETSEKEKVESGSTPKSCVRDVYERHAEEDTRHSQECGDLIPTLEPRIEA